MASLPNPQIADSMTSSSPFITAPSSPAPSPLSSFHTAESCRPSPTPPASKSSGSGKLFRPNGSKILVATPLSFSRSASMPPKTNTKVTTPTDTVQPPQHLLPRVRLPRHLPPRLLPPRLLPPRPTFKDFLARSLPDGSSTSMVTVSSLPTPPLSIADQHWSDWLQKKWSAWIEAHPDSAQEEADKALCGFYSEYFLPPAK